MTARTLTVAACAPASYGFVPEAAVPVTERIIKGEESDSQLIGEHVARLLDHQLSSLARAAASQPQIIVLPEDCLRLGTLVRYHQGERQTREIIQRAAEAYLQRIGAFCRQAKCYVAGGTVTWRGGRYYNTALLLDPSGQLIGSYDKTHLPRSGEHETFSPGTSLPVFDTPLGKIGMLICWDIVFPEPFAVLALQGAELILQPTFGHWDAQHDLVARARCLDWGVPMAVSMWGGCACIVDQGGTMLAHTGRVPETVAVAQLTLGAPRRLAYLADARELRHERRPALYRPLTRRRGK